ncbi:VanZ family protein [Paenibacillus sp. FJAT-27812]|uniref:VanZ family protein n=1 Tax=Paenibacillus sp. FJAT-27812 TaxID=1684143 RepID=UPI0006A7ED56
MYNFLIKQNIRSVLIWSVLFGLIIESSQFLISWVNNVAYRTVDLNDVVMNFLGVLFGYMIYRLFRFPIVKMMDSKSIKKSGFFEYTYKRLR